MEIMDISLKSTTAGSNTSNEGVLLLKTDNRWYPVCREGSEKVWGRKETLVACRNLQYQGGWSVELDNVPELYQDQYFKDFDCDHWCKLRILIKINQYMLE